MKRVVITGATGAIGTAIINELILNNIEVLVLCREGSARNSNIPDSPFVKKVYCNLEDLEKFPAENLGEYDVFFHLAWEGTTGDARNNMYIQNRNVKYALDAVKLASRLGCKKFVGAGSQAEYGKINSKLTPDTPAFPETGYGIGKLCAGLMTRKLAHQLKMEHNWVRVLSVYGQNDNKNSLVMSLINTLKRGEVPALTKGEQVWDYLYSGDAAKAFLSVAENGVDGKTYVLGGGKEALLSDYMKIIRDVVDENAAINLGAVPYYENQVMYLCADISELERDTGWCPEVSFKDGILNLLSNSI